MRWLILQCGTENTSKGLASVFCSCAQDQTYYHILEQQFYVKILLSHILCGFYC